MLLIISIIGGLEIFTLIAQVFLLALLCCDCDLDSIRFSLFKKSSGSTIGL